MIKHFHYTSPYREKQGDLSIFSKFSDVAPLTYAEHSAFCQKFRFPLLRGHIRSRRVALAERRVDARCGKTVQAFKGCSSFRSAYRLSFNFRFARRFAHTLPLAKSVESGTIRHYQRKGARIWERSRRDLRRKARRQLDATAQARDDSPLAKREIPRRFQRLIVNGGGYRWERKTL